MPPDPPLASRVRGKGRWLPAVRYGVCPSKSHSKLADGLLYGGPRATRPGKPRPPRSFAAARHEAGGNRGAAGTDPESVVAAREAALEQLATELEMEDSSQLDEVRARL